MTQQDRRIYLIKELLKENSAYGNIAVPVSEAEQKRLLRALFNVRGASPVNDGFFENPGRIPQRGNFKERHYRL